MHTIGFLADLQGPSSVAASSKPALNSLRDSFSASTLMPGSAMKHACSCCGQHAASGRQQDSDACRAPWGICGKRLSVCRMPGRSRLPSAFEQGCQQARHLVAHLANHRGRPRVHQVCMQNPRGLARPLFCPETWRSCGNWCACVMELSRALSRR